MTGQMVQKFKLTLRKVRSKPYSCPSLVLLDKLIVPQSVKKSATCHAVWRSLTVLTRTCCFSPSWGTQIQSSPSHPISWTVSVRLSSCLHLGFQVGSFLLVSLTKTPSSTPPLPCLYILRKKSRLKRNELQITTTQNNSAPNVQWHCQLLIQHNWCWWW
jgi:hypothetical protein